MKKGNLSLKSKQTNKKPQRKRGRDKDLIESLTSMIWFRQNQFLRTAQLANILSVCSEWPKDTSAVSPVEKQSMACC